MVKLLRFKLMLLMAMVLMGAGNVWGDEYTLCSGELTEGDYIICYGGNAMKNTVSSSRLDYAEVTVSNNKITSSNTAIEWHIAKAGDYWTIYNAAVKQYAAGTGAKNKAQLLASGTDDKSLWKVTGTATYEFVNKANAAAKVNANLRNNGTYGFACYATATGGALSLYKKQEAASDQVATPSISVNAGSFFTSKTVTISTGTDGATIYYTTDGTTPTTESTEYTDPFTINATTTVKAIAVKSGLTNSDVASETFTKITPLTVTEALEAIDALSDNGAIQNQYVLGKISQIDSYNESYKSITYWISVDGTTTNQLEVYSGKGLNGANFNSVADLELGEEVVVYGTLKKYVSGSTTTPEFTSNSSILYLKAKLVSDLAITSSNPVDLDVTTAELNPTSAITWSTSSTGAMSFSSDDESVATVSNTGVITAVGFGSTTITISQATDDDYKSGSKTVTVNVLDNRTVAAKNIDLTSAKVLTNGDSNNFSATSTKTDGFTGSIIYTYASSDESILDIDEETYSAVGVGAVTVTITATPTGGNAANYGPASQNVEVVVDGVNSISVDLESKSLLVSDAAFDINATVPTDNYDGTISAESSNTNVATVSVDGTKVTVSPVAVGTATITVTAGTGTYYPTTASKECFVEVNAPEGKSVVPTSSPTVVFYESFDTNDGTGGNDGSWDGTIASANISQDNTGWAFTNAKGADKCAKFGTSSSGGSAKTPAMSLEAGVTYTLTFKAGAWKGSNENTTLTLSSENATLSETSVTLVKGAWNDYEMTITNASDNATITFSTSAGKSRFFLDEVKVSAPAVPVVAPKVTLSASGYASYCCQYPLDFSANDKQTYRAWYVSKVEGATITFSEITGKIKGGTPFILYGTANADCQLTFGESDNELASNMLVGTLAPTYFESDAVTTYFGLSAGSFVKMNDGNVKANKAVLAIPTDKVPAAARFSVVFENEETTGIKGVKQMKENRAIYNLRGMRVTTPSKGLYIIGGKKVVIK